MRYRRTIKWVGLFTGLTLCLLWGYRYADRMAREYLGSPLSLSLIKEQVSTMTQGSQLPKGEWSYGIDISHHQPLVFWDNLKIYLDESGRTVWRQKNSVKEVNVDYVIMKASEGEKFRDWRFKSRWKAARNSGHKRGAYHFFRPGKEAVSQARNFIDQVGDILPDDFPPILDIEKTDDVSIFELNQRALEWLKIIEKHYGRKPIVYANPYYLHNILSNEIKSAYPIWVANYGTPRPGWGQWHIWQFTDRALVRGVGCVDLNVMQVK